MHELTTVKVMGMKDTKVKQMYEPRIFSDDRKKIEIVQIDLFTRYP